MKCEHGIDLNDDCYDCEFPSVDFDPMFHASQDDWANYLADEAMGGDQR